MDWNVEIINKDNKVQIDTTGFTFNITNIKFSRLYYLKGNLTRSDIKKSIKLLFKDNIIEKYHFSKIKESLAKEHPIIQEKTAKKWEVEVFYKKEVTDPGTTFILKGLNDINIKADNVRTGFRYVIEGQLNIQEILLFAKRFLANIIVQDIFIKAL